MYKSVGNSLTNQKIIQLKTNLGENNDNRTALNFVCVKFGENPQFIITQHYKWRINFYSICRQDYIDTFFNLITNAIMF